MESWKTVILKHLGRKILKHCENLVMNITAVDDGVKPAYLYDIGVITASQLVNFVKELKHEHLITNSLNVLEIEMDYLVINVGVFMHLDCVADLQRRLIDVSESLKQPCVIENPVIVNQLETVVKDIQQNLDYSAVKHYILSVDFCNVSSLFGLLLNYPVIYWYNTSSVGNCLSMEKLKSVKVSVSFSECKTLGTYQTVGYSEFILYSFSFPNCMNEHCKPIVDAWFCRVEDIINKSSHFTNIKYVTEEVILQAVCL